MRAAQRSRRLDDGLARVVVARGVSVVVVRMYSRDERATPLFLRKRSLVASESAALFRRRGRADAGLTRVERLSRDAQRQRLMSKCLVVGAVQHGLTSRARFVSRQFARVRSREFRRGAKAPTRAGRSLPPGPPQ